MGRIEISSFKFILILSLSNTLTELLIDQKRLLRDLSYSFLQYLMTSVRNEVNNLESSVVVQELEIAINLAL